jgi:hypothetical protein
MVLPACPVCHGATRFGGNKPYCPKCGWNRDAAIANVRGGLAMLPVGILMMAGFVFFMVHFWHFRAAGQIAIFALVPIFGVLINYVVLKRNLATLQALPAPAMTADSAFGALAAQPSAFAADSRVAVGPSAQDQALLRTSRPREIRMAKGGRFKLVFVILVVSLFLSIFASHVYVTWARTLSFAAFATKDWVITAITALLLLLPFGMWRSQARECDLLENGEITLGKVVRQWSDRGNSSIEYEFQDYQGAAHKGIGQDFTSKLFENMPVVVFYNRDNPKQQISACSTFHEIVT